jgi:hypothetical protein
MTKRTLVGALLVIAVAACENPLAVPNLNTPDRERVFSNPKDLGVFISGLFAIWHQSTIGGSNDGLQTQMAVMSMENTSALANFAMGPRGGIPRTPIDNVRGGQGNAGNYHDWFRGHRAARQAALGAAALKSLSLGSAALDAQARGFSRLIQGLAMGDLSLAYDSASIIEEATNPTSGAGITVPLSSYQAVNAAALRYLDSAIAIAQATPGFGTPSVPNFWFNGMAVNQALFIQIARSYKALFRANVARSPAERAAVDWTAVIADANAGITADFAPSMDPTNGWDISWVVQAFATGSANWHQMSQFWLGMADSSGLYNAWLALPNASRAPFLVSSRDLRIPRGSLRDTPGTVSRANQQSTNTLFNPGTASAGQPFSGVPYFRNRPSGEDQPGQSLQISMYDFWRSRAFRQATPARSGPYPILTAANVRLLAAEGYLRQGNFTEAINRINVSRARVVSIVTNRDTVGTCPASCTITDSLPESVAILPAIPNTITDTLAVVPGGNACVPRVPDILQSYRGTKCGNVWDALKWEYRMETAYTGYGNWYFASRGWGDLPEGTPIHWPVPYNEMDTRFQAFYPMGGVNAAGGSGAGNYGLFFGGVY